MVISVGLCLDYSIHVAQEFLLCAKKTGDDRAMEAVSRVGKAVFNGGFTTFLGMAILGMGPGKPFYGFASLFLCTAHTLLSASLYRWAHGRVLCSDRRHGGARSVPRPGGAAGGAVVGAARVDCRGAVEPRRGGQGRGAGQEALSGGLDLLHS